jgi:hypothetical protein
VQSASNIHSPPPTRTTTSSALQANRPGTSFSMARAPTGGWY